MRAFLASRQRHQFVFAAIALAIPALLVAGFYHDAGMPPPPQGPIYVQSWPASRSDAEIVKQNIADQKIRDAQNEERRRQWQKLKDQMGDL